MPFIHRPMGRGSGALTWWESFEVAKVAWHRGGGAQGGENLLAPPRQGRKGKSGGKRGWEEDQAAATCRIRLPLRPRDARVGRRGPSPPALPGRHSPSPLFFLPTSISTRAHIRRLCGFFTPREKKNREWKGREGKAKNSSGALCTPSHGWARGRCCHRHRRLALSPALQRVPVGARARALDSGDTERLLAATAAAGRRDSGEKGPATAFPSSAAPAGPLRRPGTGKQGGAEAQEKRAAARPPVDAAPGGAWRQLCRVTRWEDCRARRPGGLGTSCKKGPRSGAPPHSSLSSRRPGAGEKDLPITAAASGGRVLAASSDRARRSGAVAGPQPQRPPQRRARGLRHLRFSLQSDLRPLPPLPSTFPARPSQATVPAPLLPLLAFASPRSGGCGGPRRGEDGQAADA